MTTLSVRPLVFATAIDLAMRMRDTHPTMEECLQTCGAIMAMLQHFAMRHEPGEGFTHDECDAQMAAGFVTMQKRIEKMEEKERKTH